MPRIDPHQLLKTLGVLLAPSGGIKSNDEVIRLVTLMHKFSKKLVSKCIYVKILRATTQELLDRFLEVTNQPSTLSFIFRLILCISSENFDYLTVVYFLI